MVKDAIDAFVQQDLALAQSIESCDDVVDQLFLQVRDDLIHIIRENSGDIEAAVESVNDRQVFRRIGDHAVNISEWVIFSITGDHITNESRG